MDSSEARNEALWSGLLSVALQPMDLAEIADIFAVVRRGASSSVLAWHLGPAHALVRLADAVIAGSRTLSPERSALVVVVAAFLCRPSLCKQWFGDSAGSRELSWVKARALGEFGLDVEHYLG